jgi:hypothetical protein
MLFHNPNGEPAVFPDFIHESLLIFPENQGLRKWLHEMAKMISL